MAAILITLGSLGFSTAASASAGSARSAQATSQSAELQAQINQVLTAHPGGTQISPNSVAWRNGSVILTLPSPGYDRAPADLAAISRVRSRPGTGAQPDADLHGCPYSASAGGEHDYCFYTDSNFGGKRLQFFGSFCPGVADNFTNYDNTNDTVSSWVNTTGLTGFPGKTITVFRDINLRGGRLWQEPPATVSTYVGDANNDQASSWSC